MTKFDWIFVAVCQIAGLTLLAYGISQFNSHAGGGLFCVLFSLWLIGTAAYHVRLEEYR